MKQKVALVLSGGGARGMAHIGVIEELENHGFEISSIAGTSMGAVVGGVYALGKMEAFKK
jgi:NTE family protein